MNNDLKVLIHDRRIKDKNKIKDIKKLALKKYNSSSSLQRLKNDFGGAVFSVSYQHRSMGVEVTNKNRRTRRG